MLYMVEMDFNTPAREAEWNAWYSAHLAKLLSMPGFHAVQRLRADGPIRSPYLAIYEVDGPEVFESGPYTSRAGRDSTGEWKALMFDWHRNLLAGMPGLPEVGPTEALLVVDRASAADPALPAGLTPLQCVGLDRTVMERGVGAMAPEQAARIAASTTLFSRVFRPMITPIRNGAGHAKA